MLLSEVQGQPKAVKLLNRALESDRLAHGYLFTGPDGVGKTTAARAMAAALFCQQEKEHSSAHCGTCPGCLKFSTDNHPDFLHITPHGATIKIDQVRELKKALSFPPLEAGYRITLIEDIHTMRREAANSLLKLLEEPPPGNILLLTSDEAEQLLPTITSRCQVIPFFSLPFNLTAEIIQNNEPGLTMEKAAFLASLTNGCPGLAKSFDTEELLKLRKEIIQKLLAQLTDEAEEVETALVLAAKAADLKDGLEALLDLLRFFFKEAMIARLQNSIRESGSSELDNEIMRARERWNLQELSDKVDAVDYAEQTLARNCNKGLVCEVLFMHLLDSNSR